MHRPITAEWLLANPDYTCECGLYVHPAKSKLGAIHMPDCQFAAPKMTYYACGICGSYHSAEWDGDCREDGGRFDAEQLDEKYGPNGWGEVPMPGGEDTGS
jgi:hypothetical protein